LGVLYKRAKRVNNVIVRGVPESEDTPDLVAVQEVLTAIMPVDEVDEPKIEPKAVFRLGARREDGKPRPTKVILKSEADKRKVLRRAKFIREADSLSFDRYVVYIVPDQTQLERQENSKLREALRKKREIDPNWVIRGGRIVRKQPVPVE
jgi:hypothetical protein